MYNCINRKEILFMEYLTINEIAEKFGVHYQTVRNWVTQGMPCYKNKSFIKFKLSEVEEWLKKGATND